MSSAVAITQATLGVSSCTPIGDASSRVGRRRRPGHPLVRRFWAIWLRLYRAGPRPKLRSLPGL
jgi:hypothetical protein